jgi:membrane protein YqaA with SNARE-associated domain
LLYFSLFLSALLSATLLPGSSEVLLVSLLINKQSSIILLWLFATLGNVIGSTINYYLGLKLMCFRNRSWFPINQHQLIKGERFFGSYGKWGLLLAWLPVVGDAITLIAGVFKVNLVWFLVLVTLGKGLRYAAVIALALGIVKLV